MKQARKIRAKNQLIDALKIRNRPLVDFIHDFSLHFDVLVWQKGNVGQTSKWTDLFKLLSIKGKTFKIHLPSGPTEFQSIVVKPYFVNDDNTENHSSATAEFLPLAQNLLSDTTPLFATETFMLISRSF